MESNNQSVSINSNFNYKKSNLLKTVNFFAFSGLSFIMLSTLFIYMKWHGAAMFIIFGTLIFVFSVLIKSMLKHGLSGMQRFRFFLALNCISLIVLAFTFKAMWWPGQSTFSIILFISLLVLILLQVVSYKKDKNATFISEVNIFIVCLAYLFFFMYSRSLSRSIYPHNKIYENLSLNIKNTSEKVDNTVLSINEISRTDSNALFWVEKTNSISKIFDEQYTYINNLKKEIVQQTEKQGSYKDSISLDKDIDKGYSTRYFINGDDFDTPTYILIGDNEFNPQSGPNTAKELREKLNSGAAKIKSVFESIQKDPKLKLSESEYKLVMNEIESSIPRDSDKIEDGVKESWEVENFYYINLTRVLNNLTQIQLNLKQHQLVLLSKLSVKASCK
ncbi:MAG: hypothetical protein ACK5AY_11695 [Bacteroidota bacterium]|jgi:hypothetical protein